MNEALGTAIAKAAASNSELLKEIYGDLAKPGVAQVGHALGTVLGLGNTILWPVQLLNERAKFLLEASMNRYREKVEKIPSEKICAVSTEVGVPILEKLGYVADPDLREMYATLLAKASCTDTQSQAHPSFVNVLNNMSPDEAVLLHHLSQKGGAIPFVSAHFGNPQTGSYIQIGDVHPEVNANREFVYPNNLPAYVGNLAGMGLINVRSNMSLESDKYLALEAKIKDQYSQVNFFDGFTELHLFRGTIDVTSFGWMFIHSCVS
jgi:hypothetical protein